MNTQELTHTIVTFLDENKAQTILTLDVTPLTQIMDTIVIATASSARHAHALADKLMRHLANEHIKPMGIEGLEESEWILLDYYDVVVHIMTAHTREFYSLEKLWCVTVQNEH